jgi:ATP-dependent Lon protease
MKGPGTGAGPFLLRADLLPYCRPLPSEPTTPLNSTMPFRLPLFPLPIVLFPGISLPLHVFEPRYKRLLADCLQGDRRFGITPVSSETELPAAGAVGCVAEVRVNQELPDGRSNIVVLGGSRFWVSHVLEEQHPYLTAEVEPFEDDAGAKVAAADTARLRELFGGYFAVVRELNDLVAEEPSLPGAASDLSFQVAGMIECDLGVKIRLLADRSAVRRTKTLILLLPVLTSGIGAALAVHQHAHTNGKGGSMPDPAAR